MRRPSSRRRGPPPPTRGDLYPAREPMPAPPLDALTGDFAEPSFGTLSLARDGERLVGTLSTGAKLASSRGTARSSVVSLVPEGRFAPIAANLGPFPAGFATFALGPDGKVTGFRLALDEAPAADLRLRRRSSRVRARRGRPAPRSCAHAAARWSGRVASVK